MSRSFTREAKSEYLSQMQREINRKRSKVRARVEHAIGVTNASSALPRWLPGTGKNGNPLFVAAALANLFTVRRPLMDALRAQVRP